MLSLDYHTICCDLVRTTCSGHWLLEIGKGNLHIETRFVQQRLFWNRSESGFESLLSYDRKTQGIQNILLDGATELSKEILNTNSMFFKYLFPQCKSIRFVLGTGESMVIVQHLKGCFRVTFQQTIFPFRVLL